MKHKKLLIAPAVLLVLLIAFLAFASDCYRADEAAVAAMASASGICVERDDDAIAFIPDAPEAGFIFYPGGRVEHDAYAPLMRALAEGGILCVLPDMPLNLAIFDMNAAEGVPDKYPQVEKWYIGGHSLGGSMAASRAAKNPDEYEGLALLASYSTEDLGASGMEVISIYGSEDGVLNMDNYAKYRDKLPGSMEEHILEGGNHAGFGSYGPQDGDGMPSISGGEQIDRTARLLLDFFR